MVAETNEVVSRGRWRPRLIRWGIEAWPVVVAAFAGLIAMGHIADSPWKDTFLYNSDSLILPMIEKSIANGESMHWIFSSQNFLFPEGLFFFLSTLFTDSPQTALLTNGVLNIVALYVLLRVIAHLLAHRSRHRYVEISIALAATFLFVVYVLLEPTASVNRSGIASTFLMTTYYYGVILTGLGLIALALWVTRSFSQADWGRRRSIIFAVASAALATITTFSDPLYVMQVVAPFAVTALLLVFLNRLSWRGLLVLLAPTAVGVLIGFGLRVVFRSIFASGLGSYVAINNIPEAIKLFRTALFEMLSSAQGTFKLLISAVILIITVAILVFALYAQSRPRLARRIATAEVFIAAFVSISAISLVVGQVLTGTTNTRYLEPLFLFPLLTVVSVGVYILRRLLVEVKSSEMRRSLSRFNLGIGVLASALIVVLGVISTPPVVRAANGEGYTGTACFDDFVGDKDINGVGSFWSVRALDLYGHSEGRVLQVEDEFRVFQWMNNITPYADKTLSYVVDDGAGQFDNEDIAALGEPADVIQCPSYVIYDYAGTDGEDILTDRVAANLAQILG